MSRTAWTIAFVSISGALLVGVFAARHVRYVARVERAAEIGREAADLERQGRLQAAYQAAHGVCEGVLRIERRDIPEGLCAQSMRLHNTILVAYDDTMRALNAYRDRNGRYPDTLDQVETQIPLVSLAAYRGFQYVRRSDADADLVTGLYGSVVFDLSAR